MSGFIGDTLNFELSHGRNFLRGIKKDPKRIFLGVDPWSTKVWNKVLNKDDKPLVDQMGGPTKGDYKQAEKEGINTKSGHKMQDVAHVIAALYAGNGIANSGMWGGSGASGGSQLGYGTQQGTSGAGIGGHGASVSGLNGGGGASGNWFTNAMNANAGNTNTSYGKLIGQMMQNQGQNNQQASQQYQAQVGQHQNPYQGPNYQYNPYQPSYFNPNSFQG